MKRYLLAVIGIKRSYMLRFFRDKTALFFTFLFPLIFLFVFGAIFNNNEVSFNIALVNNSQEEFAKSFVEDVSSSETFSIEEDVIDVEDAKQKMSRGEIDSVVELPENFGTVNENGVPAGQMTVYYQKGSEQSGQTVAAIMEQILGEINIQYGYPEPPLAVQQKSTDSAGLSQFDYTFSGLLGFALLSMAIFGLSNTMPQEKKTGAFRRLRASPIQASQLILANGLHYFVVTAMSVLSMILVGIFVFNFDMRGSWLVFAVYASMATIMLLGFGLLIGGWAKNENQSAPISNLIAFPMMFLSGIFFPRFLFPQWLQGITEYIPLAPAVDGFRLIMTEGAGLADLLPEISIMLAWILIVYLLATKFFRWE